LYDRAADPGETRNVFADRKNTVVVDELYSRLLEWQKATDDSLRTPFPKPA
jgi:hypothetical protein